MQLDDYDNYIFDLYGTLIDMWTDEHCAQTWKKWLRWLDVHGFPHPDYIRFRREFFDMDRQHREEALAAGPYEVPEIDVIPIYEELFARYAREGLYGRRRQVRGRRGHRRLYGSEQSCDMSVQRRSAPTATVEEASYAFRVASRLRFGLFPGVNEYLTALRQAGRHVYILSNAQASYTLPEIKHYHLDELVDDYIMSSDRGVMKPDPAFFDMLIEKHHMNRERTVMLGDSEWSDVGGAARAGIKSVWLHGNNSATHFYTDQIRAL